MKVAHITIQTKNFEAEVDFYRKYMGMDIQKEIQSAGKNIVFLADTAEDTMIEIVEKSDADNAGNENLSLGFHISDPETKRAEFEAAGFEMTPVISPMPHVKFFFVKDPAGVKIQIM